LQRYKKLGSINILLRYLIFFIDLWVLYVDLWWIGGYGWSFWKKQESKLWNEFFFVFLQAERGTGATGVSL
jgi:hypothetical protein